MAPDRLTDRRLRSHKPQELLSGPAAARPIALAQAYLGAGAALISAVAVLLPHPDYFNVTAILAVDLAALIWSAWMFRKAGRIPFWLMRLGPAAATVMTSAAVHFSGDATSGYALFYVWVALYVFYFPITKADAALNVTWALVNYAVVIAITPIDPPGGTNVVVSHFVITVGTLVTAATLLTYLRGRVEKLLARLTDAARTDPLTGLPNRVALHELLERELDRAQPDGRPVSLVVLDVDRFKKVNERLGLATGDSTLRRLSALLEQNSRRMDFVARSGGEEFAIVLPETNQHQAFLFAEEILDKIRGIKLSRDVSLSASAGVAVFPDHGMDMEDVTAAADSALHAAKSLGRDRAVIYSPEVTNVLGAVSGRRSVEEQAHVATVLSLAEALDQRDSGTAKHSQTVGRYCELMAQELGFEEDRVERLRLAGVLHDIGKIGVPDSILRKAGPLSEQEMDQMRRHPELGARMLSSSELDDVREWILAHHERPDGSGYPLGLSGDQIPIEAAILSVGDAYEAMTSDRVYRLAMSHADAREELLRCAGSQFEPSVVRALLRALDRHPAAVS